MSADILLSIDKVVYAAGKRVLEQAVDCEVAALSVTGGVRLKPDVFRMSAVRVIALASKSSDFDANVAAALDENDSKLRPNQLRTGKERFDLLGPGIRTDVEVLWSDTPKAISNTAAY